MNKLSRIFENTLYTDDASKKLASDNLGDYFWTNIFMILGAYKANKDNQHLINYLRKYPVQIQKINDNSADFLICLKLLKEKAEALGDNIDALLSEFTRFLAYIKQGIGPIDEDKTKALLIKFKIRFINNL